MRVLLDTHALLWSDLEPQRLSGRARSLLESLSTEVLVSAVSAWEIVTKVRIGKLPGAGAFAADFANRIELLGFESLDISLEHALRAGQLPGPHRDPFDRMIIAQAQAENLAIVSNEKVFDGYGVRRIW